MAEPIKSEDLPDVTASEAFAAPQDVSPAGVRAWIREIASDLGVTPTEVARRAGLAASTVNRFLRAPDTDLTQNLSGRSIQQILAAANSMRETTTLYDTIPVVDNPDYQFRSVLVGMYAKIGWKKRSSFVKRANRMFLYVPTELSDKAKGIAGVEIGDDHAAPIFPKGSIVLAMAPFNLGRPPVSGEYVVYAQRSPEYEVGTVWENTIRKYVESPSGQKWLVPVNPDLGLKDVLLTRIDESTMRFQAFEGVLTYIVIGAVQYNFLRA